MVNTLQIYAISTKKQVSIAKTPGFVNNSEILLITLALYPFDFNCFENMKEFYI